MRPTYDQLLEVLRICQSALNAAPRFKIPVHPDDSYKLAAIVDNTLLDAQKTEIRADLLTRLTKEGDIKSLIETSCDIAYFAGFHGHHSGDSREDLDAYLAWAIEFESARVIDEHGDQRYFGRDYLEAAEIFARKKLHEAGNLKIPIENEFEQTKGS
jgi:hypothetical protein